MSPYRTRPGRIAVRCRWTIRRRDLSKCRRSHPHRPPQDSRPRTALPVFAAVGVAPPSPPRAAPTAWPAVRGRYPNAPHRLRGGGAQGWNRLGFGLFHAAGGSLINFSTTGRPILDGNVENMAGKKFERNSV